MEQITCPNCHELIDGDPKHECKLTAKDYQAAIDVQTACNLGAVIHSFSRVMNKIQAAARNNGKSTGWVNNHPISRMYAEQIMHLTRNSSYSKAYDECERLQTDDNLHIKPGMEVITLEGDNNYENVKLNKLPLDPKPSQEVYNHSPDGFSWGYNGSGPAQLALAVLLECLPQKLAISYYHDFMREYIIHLPQESHFKLTLDMKAFITSRMHQLV